MRIYIDDVGIHSRVCVVQNIDGDERSNWLEWKHHPEGMYIETGSGVSESNWVIGSHHKELSNDQVNSLLEAITVVVQEMVNENSSK